MKNIAKLVLISVGGLALTVSFTAGAAYGFLINAFPADADFNADF